MLDVTGNLIESLDISSNSNLVRLDCYNNNLNYLNMQNGNNTNFLSFNAQMNPDLNCIQVDDADYSSNSSTWMFIDSHTSYGEDCSILSIEENVLNKIEIYPNPVLNEFSLSSVTHFESIEIYDINGRMIKTFTTQQNTYDISSFEKGVYFMNIYHHNTNFVKKIMKL